MAVIFSLQEPHCGPQLVILVTRIVKNALVRLTDDSRDLLFILVLVVLTIELLIHLRERLCIRGTRILIVEHCLGRLLSAKDGRSQLLRIQGSHPVESALRSPRLPIYGPLVPMEEKRGATIWITSLLAAVKTRFVQALRSRHTIMQTSPQQQGSVDISCKEFYAAE
jgi:hypothetical protein